MSERTTQTRNHAFDLVKFIEHVEVIRRSRKLSLRKAEQETGVAASTLNRVANGQGEMTIQNVAALALWSNLNLTDYLLTPRAEQQGETK